MNKPLATPRHALLQRLRGATRSTVAVASVLAATASFAAGDTTRQADQASLWFVVLMLAFVATLIGGFWLHGERAAATTLNPSPKPRRTR